VSIRLDEGGAETIAAEHDAAATTIRSAASSFPAAPQAGEGGDKVAAIITAVAETADTLAGLNEVCAAHLRDIGGNYARTEDHVAQMFDGMREELS